MKRLYFLVPDLKTTHDIARELEKTGITHSHIHAVGNAEAGAQLTASHVHEASLLQTTKLLPNLKKGIFFGLVITLILFVLSNWFLPDSIEVSGLGILAVFVFGCGFGIWLSGMIGLSMKDPIIEKNEDYVAQGHFILIVDIPKVRVEELVKKITKHHPTTKVASESFQSDAA